MASTGTGLALIVFECAAGQEANVGVTGLSVGGGGLPVVEISILDPYGSTLTRSIFTELGGDIDTAVLRDSGDHTVLVDSLEASLENVTLTLSQPVIRALVVDGPPLDIALRPGQNGRLTFEGTAGQHLGLGVGEGQFGPGGPNGEISIARPNGSNMVSRVLTRSAMSIHLGPLPETGTYTIEVNAREAELASLIFTLSRSLTGALLIDGPTRVVELRQGQDARLEFDVAAGARVNLGITEARFTNNNDTAGGTVSIRHPDTTTLGSTIIRTSGSKIATEPLAEPGTYLIVVDPDDAALESIALTLTHPLAGTLDIDGPEVGFDLRPGQDARLLFAGIAGQRVRVDISDVSFDVGGFISGGTLSILQPDGTSLASTTLVTGDSNVDVGPLPDTAPYALVVQPPAGFSVSFTLRLTRVA